MNTRYLHCSTHYKSSTQRPAPHQRQQRKDKHGVAKVAVREVVTKKTLQYLTQGGFSDWGVVCQATKTYP